MKNYTSCFLGIPLSKEYLGEFNQLLRDIHIIDPFIEIVHPQTPHITIYYLNQQSQYSLEEIAKLVQFSMENLLGTTLMIGGFNYFTRDDPKVLFLDVTYPTSFIAYKNKVSQALKEFRGLDNSLTFHPHMTVGRIGSTSAYKSFKENKRKLAVKLNEIHWNFKISEIALYGMDAKQSPEHQEKLLTIPVG